VTVDVTKLALAGYSLGAGRALRGAAGDVDGVVGAVIAMHAWGVPSRGFFSDRDRVKVPVLFLSATEDTNAPFRDSEATYERATGPKLIAALRDQNHYTSPRFWAGATVAFVLSAFQVEPFAEHADRVVWGGGKQTGLVNDAMLTWTREDCGWFRQDASRACAA
jgi:dienelactone hydrolase